MTKETILKLYNHFKEVAEGKIKTSNQVRNDLLISDAKKNLEDLERKFPELLKTEKKEKVKKD